MREVMKVKQDIIQTIVHKLKWYGYVHRKSSNRLPKAIIDWNPNDKWKKKKVLKFHQNNRN